MTRDNSLPEQPSKDTRSSHVKAMDKVSQITSISLCFAIPIIAGYYLDQWLGTKILFTVLCLFFGMAAAGVQFRRLLKTLDRESKQAREKYKSTRNK
jgi:F0F1-type ATP synthase assembly protein I